jgi:hemerythrin-like domain-containing protein
MASPEVRRRVLKDHAELRAVSAAVEVLAEQVAKGDAGSMGALRLRGRELHERLCEHLELEDRLLVPAIREAGSDGLECAESLSREHSEQRALLEYVLERLNDLTRPSAVLGRELLNFAELLADDMEYEESAVLPYLDLRPD